MKQSSTTRSLLAAALLILFAASVCKSIHLEFSDLGRHLMNGKQVLGGNFDALSKNLYSYTFPNFPFPNHHWGFGVLAELVRRLVGFSGLSVVYLLLEVATFGIAYFIANELGGFAAATGVALVALPLVAARSEIRPEGISAFFCMIFLTALVRERRWLPSAALPILSAIWVNVHIYFFLGWLIVTAFLGEAILRRETSRARKLSIVLLACLAASFINPLGWKLVAFPFQIFGNYGYPVAENQAVITLVRGGLLKNLFPPFLLLHLLLLSGVAIARRQRFPLALSVVTIATSAMAWLIARNIALCALCAWPCIASLWASAERRKNLRLAGLIMAAAQCIFLLWKIFPETYFRFGVGLEAGTESAANFLIKEKIEGPIFNNFDVAGYLIYYLFPGERVFMDNRPEAYPADFLKSIYIPMQEDPRTWSAVDSKIKFNAIVIRWPDPTPWNLAFRQARGRDPAWAPVYMDPAILIYLKRDPKNAAVIAGHEIH